MRLSMKDNIFVVESSFKDKDILKQAGFWYNDPVGCRRKDSCDACAIGHKGWWTPHKHVAVSLIEHADESAKSVLEKFVQSLNKPKRKTKKQKQLEKEHREKETLRKMILKHGQIVFKWIESTESELRRLGFREDDIKELLK